MNSRLLSGESAVRNGWVMALMIGAATLLASAGQAGVGPDYCAIDIRCSVGPWPGGQENCFADETQQVTLHYDFVGGTAEIIDNRFGVVGIYTGTTLTRTLSLGSYGSYTATFNPIEAVCLVGIFSDTVYVNHAQPTPTSSPTATPTASPTPSATPTSSPTLPPQPPGPCVEAWPVTKVTTQAKGQSPTNNPKVLHAITGNIVDPGSLGDTAHRIPVCAGTEVTAVVTDSTGTPRNIASGTLHCEAAGCYGVVDVKEEYQSISQDGQDKDKITFIPK